MPRIRRGSAPWNKEVADELKLCCLSAREQARTSRPEDRQALLQLQAIAFHGRVIGMDAVAAQRHADKIAQGEYETESSGTDACQAEGEEDEEPSSEGSSKEDQRDSLKSYPDRTRHRGGAGSRQRFLERRRAQEVHKSTFTQRLEQSVAHTRA